MTNTEPGTTHSESSASNAEALAWLDGMAGRDTSCDASQEGARLREALLQETSAVSQPDWSHIQRLAEGTPVPLEPPAVKLNEDCLAKPPANQPFFGSRYGWAATIAVCAVLLFTQWPQGRDEAPQFRGSDATAATVRSAAPLETARGLADELRALGASVQTQTGKDNIVLDIRVPLSAVQRVNQRLQELETGLDANGTLALRVLPLER